MSIFGLLGKTVVNIVAIPVEVVRDVAEIGRTGEEPTNTIDRLNKIIEDIEDEDS